MRWHYLPMFKYSQKRRKKKERKRIITLIYKFKQIQILYFFHEGKKKKKNGTAKNIFVCHLLESYTFHSFLKLLHSLILRKLDQQINVRHCTSIDLHAINSSFSLNAFIRACLKQDPRETQHCLSLAITHCICK